MLSQRNALIDQFRLMPSGAVFRLYLGLQQPDGPTDERYPNLMKGAQVQTDDVIIFGKGLAELLQQHAKKVAKEYGKSAPKVAQVDFSQLAKLGILPDAKEYEDLFAALRGEGIGKG
jgi:hypothetical protein